MRHILVVLLRTGAIAVALGAAGLSLLAALGAAMPVLDILNHLQLPIFFATLIGLLLVYHLVRHGPWGWFVVALTAAGFLASAVAVVPEIASSLMPRPPLPTDGRPVFKAMTHNVFGLNYDMDRVAANIFAEDPDIVAVQEYFPEQRVPLHRKLIARYPYFAYCIGGKRANIGLYAKRPFAHTEEGACARRGERDERISRIVGTFTLDDGTQFSVMTTHLDWPYPVERQRRQLEDLATAIGAVKGPLIVVGDMNSTPWSYAMRGLVETSGVTRQTRNLITYPLAIGGDNSLIRTVPFLPLDHVFTRGEIEVHEVHAGNDDGSDHLPVVFTFSVAPMTECCRPGS